MGALGDVVAPQVVVWTLLLLHGKSTVAAHSAMISLLGVSHPLIFSIQSIVVPALSRRLTQVGERAAITGGIADAAPIALTAIGFVLLIGAFPVEIISVVFGAGNRYVDYAGALRLGALSYVVVILAECLECAAPRSRLVAAAAEHAACRASGGAQRRNLAGGGFRCVRFGDRRWRGGHRPGRRGHRGLVARAASARCMPRAQQMKAGIPVLFRAAASARRSAAGGCPRSRPSQDTTAQRGLAPGPAFAACPGAKDDD
ncbi:hypothetical protein [Dankookia sp. P2]|uniref:hypothetical protein n=1 Tax=Dankookia sp. P2 TaxID=3423955 RepID=UPI003D67B407